MTLKEWLESQESSLTDIAIELKSKQDVDVSADALGRYSRLERKCPDDLRLAIERMTSGRVTAHSSDWVKPTPANDTPTTETAADSFGSTSDLEDAA